MEGADWFPGQQREIVRYPAGQVQGHVLERLFPGIGKLDQNFPGMGLDGPSVGESVDEGVNNLDSAIRTTGRPGTAIGLSEGGFVVDGEQARLATDPTAPPPNTLNFATFGDPIGHHAFGQSFLTAMFPVGSVVPALDYTMPPQYESQYDTNRFVAAYDSIADFPDRPDNLFALANTLMGLAEGHTRGGLHQPEHGAAAEHPDDDQFPRRERHDDHDPGKAPSSRHAAEVHRDPGRHAEQARRNPDSPGERGLFAKRRPGHRTDSGRPGARVRPSGGHCAGNQATFGGGADPFSQISRSWPVTCPCCRTAQAKPATTDSEPTDSTN